MSNSHFAITTLDKMRTDYKYMHGTTLFSWNYFLYSIYMSIKLMRLRGYRILSPFGEAKSPVVKESHIHCVILGKLTSLGFNSS